MAKDFRAERIRISAIVATGSVGFTRSAASAGGAAPLPHLGLLVYSSSQATNFKGGRVDSAMLDQVGSDVWMVVSGSRNNSAIKNSQKAAGSSVLFQGDVVVSGTLWAERSVVEVDDSTVGNFRVPNKFIQGFTTNPDTGTSLALFDPFTATGGSNGNGTISFKKVAGSSGTYTYPAATNKDVFFHVSGSRGVKNTNDRGVSLFDGDVHVSGNLSTDPLGTTSIGADLFVTGNLIVTGNLHLGSDDIYDSGHNLVVSFDGEGGIDSIATVTGSGIIVGDMSGMSGMNFAGDNNRAFLLLHRNENQTTSTTLDGPNGQDLGMIQFSSNRPGSPVSTATAQISTHGINPFTSTDMGSFLSLQVSPPGTRVLEQRIQIIDTLTVVTGALKLSPAPDADTQGTPREFASIIDNDNFEVLTLSGSGDATFNNNLTVLGNLNVSGSTTTIDTTNLKVKDQLILLATGSTGPNVKGGLAITSGSAQANRALVWGAGQTANSFRVSTFDVEDGNRTSGLEQQEVGLIEAGGLILSGSGTGYAFQLSGTMGGDGRYNVTASVGGTANAGSLYLYSAQKAVKVHAIRAIELEAGGDGVRIMPYYDGSSTSYRDFWLDGLNLRSKIDTIQGTGTRFSHLPGVNTPAKFRFDSNDGLAIDLVFGSTSGGESRNKIRSMDSMQGGLRASVGYRDQLYISGSGVVRLSNQAHEGAYGDLRPASITTAISQSANEPGGGGPNIILSSSSEFSADNSREGYLTLGVGTAAQVDSLFTATRHRDVRTILSGTVGAKDSNTRGVTLVAGDLVVSGNSSFVGATNIGSISTDNLTLNSVASQEPYIRFRNNTTQIRRNGDDLELSASNGSGMMKFVDTVTGPHTLQDLASLSVVDNTDVFTINGGEPSYVKTTGSFSFDTSDRYTTVLGSDTYFFVSGAVGSTGTTTRGTAVFGGDMMVSGTIRSATPLFLTSLNTAYNTPDVPGGSTSFVPGGGCSIDLTSAGSLGPPVQIQGDTGNSDASVLALTGSLTLRYSGGGSNSRIRMETDNALEFHNSAGEVFRLLAGSSGTHARLAGNNQLNFQDDSRFIYGLTQDSVKKLRLHNNSAGGTIVVSTTSGRMEVTGSILPGADNTHNLGSPDYRWANLYTGDLHLRNERGNWTIYEEPDMLVVVNNLTGKKYKMGLTPLEDEE